MLLAKLYHYGIRGVTWDWFKSYLSNRQQYVAIGSSISGKLRVTHGVPQGSILGTLLFLIFINDLPQAAREFDYTLFADDSTLSCAIPRRDILSVRTNINRSLAAIHTWLSLNKISINPDKTKYLIFSYSNCYVIPGIKIGNHSIKSADSVKF